MRSSASYMSVGFGFLSHVGQLGRHRKTPETINVNRREALVRRRPTAGTVNGMPVVHGAWIKRWMVDLA